MSLCAVEATQRPIREIRITVTPQYIRPGERECVRESWREREREREIMREIYRMRERERESERE